LLKSNNENSTAHSGAARYSVWKLSLLAFCLAVFAAMTGCASFNRSVKSLVGDEKPKVTKYSDQENLRFQSDRKYRRMNKNKFEDEAEVSAQAGSLWVMEGQGAYLFAQNQTRVMGDLLNVRVEGNPRSQLSSKVKVISKLLDRLDAPLRGPASAQAANNAKPGASSDATTKKDEDTEAAAAGRAAAGGDKAAAEKGFDPKDPISTIQTVPTRIVEQLKDGSYRVKGVQPFMIGKREYKVIVTGVVRPEDFDDAGIESSKLLDSQFDIVSSRKGATL
jgi:flagellar L-ring protein precursor FlgH